MPYIFYPPVYYGAPEDIQAPRLFRFYARGYAYGLSVLKFSDHDYQIIETPTTEEIQASKRAYLGGRRYVVTDAEASLLIEAGYIDMLFPVPVLDIYSDTYYDTYGVPAELPTPEDPHSPPANGDVPDVEPDPDPDPGGSGGFGGYGDGPYGDNTYGG